MRVKRIKADSNLCFKVEGGKPVMLLLYVDELFLTRKEEFIKVARRGSLLGIEVWQNADGISLRQGKYTIEILKRFEMMDCKAMTTLMASNLKLLSDALLESVDATMYHQMIGP